MNGENNFQYNQNVTPSFQPTQMPQNFPQEKKSNTGKTIVIILLILILIGVVGFIVYKKVSEEKKDDVKTEQKVEKKETEGELIEVDEAVANEKLKLLNIAMHYSFDYKNLTATNWYLPGNFDYDKELLNGKGIKCDLTFLSFVLQNDKDLLVGATPSGEEKENFYGIPKAVFIKRYKDLFGEDLQGGSTYASNVSSYFVKDDIVYGTYYPDTVINGTDFKFKDLRKVDNRYILTIDVIVKDGTSNVDDVPDYLFKMELNKVNDETYTIKSGKFFEK